MRLPRGIRRLFRPPRVITQDDNKMPSVHRDVVSAKSTQEFAYHAPGIATMVFGAVTILAVLLAAVGLCGIIAHAVARRALRVDPMDTLRVE